MLYLNLLSPIFHVLPTEEPPDSAIASLNYGWHIEPRFEADLENHREAKIPQFLLLHIGVGLTGHNVTVKHVGKLDGKSNEAEEVDQQPVAL